jgi:outer membrane protein
MKNNHCAVIASLLSALVLTAEPLKLSVAYECALKNEPHLQAMAIKTASSKEQIEQSRSKLYPQLQGTFSVGQYGYQYVTPSAKPISEGYSSYSISATQPLIHPELWRGVDEAKSRQKGAEYEFQTNAQQLGLDVAKAYFAILYSQKNRELIEAQQNYYTKKYEQLDAMLKVGLSNKMDVLEAKVQRDKSISEAFGEKKKLAVAKLKLAHLTHQEVEELQAFDFAHIEVTKLLSTRQEWEDKLSDNPALRSALASEETAVHEVAVREYEHYPKVDLSLSRKETYTQDQISHKYDNQAIAQVTLPLYQGGYTQSRVREGRMLLNAARLERDYYQNETRYKFESLWAEHQLTIETLEVLKESEKSAELYLKAVEKGNVAGLKSLLDVLDAVAKLYDVRRQMVDAGYQLMNNQLGLLDVTGRLTVETMANYESLLNPP